MLLLSFSPVLNFSKSFFLWYPLYINYFIISDEPLSNVDEASKNVYKEKSILFLKMKSLGFYFLSIFGFEIFILQRSSLISQGAVQIVVGLLVAGFFLLCTIVDHCPCLS